MNLDRVLHETKTFAELEDADVAGFLTDRPFNSEHLNLEFKATFPGNKERKYDIKKICKYIVGFSNEEGGLVVYGVADSINNAASRLPDYLTGLGQHPTLEDLSQWVTERIYPLVQSPAIRFFLVNGRKIAVIKIPSGVNKPYCYCEPNTNSMTFFKKTAGGILELRPEDVRELYRNAIIEQSERILRASVLQSGQNPPSNSEASVTKHKAFVVPKLENVTDFGHVGIYCIPYDVITIPVAELEKFVTDHRFGFSEVLRYFPQPEPFQGGVTFGYYPRAIRQEIKCTARITLYRDGLIAFDSLADMHMEGNRNLHPYWLTYELQRQLQLAKAILAPYGVERIKVNVELDGIENFSLIFGHRFGGTSSSAYAGSHDPIVRDVVLAEIHDYDSRERNIVTSPIQDMMDEVSRIFGLSKTPPGVWDAGGSLAYVKGLEGQR